MLKTTIIGYLGQDATTKEASSGNWVINFDVAHTEKYKDEKRTVWVKCAYWRKADQLKVSEYLKKGTQVYVEGKPSTEHYTDKNGTIVSRLVITVNEVQLLGGGNANGGEGATQYKGESSSAPANTGQPDAGDNDLPF
jgi:single-strand DNA-binding protein